MPLRPTHAAIFGIVQSTLERRLSEVVRAQAQASGGKRITRPSDDPVGASIAIDLRGEQALVARWRETAATVKPYVDSANAALYSAQDLIGQIRSLTVQGLSATMNGSDRDGLANQIEAMKASLLEVANTSFDGKYLFGGTASSAKPFTESAGGVVKYRGNDDLHSVILGREVEVPINVPGADIFQSRDPRGLAIAGVSGVTASSAPSQGVGWVDVDVRHDATSGMPGSGLALASGGADDSFLGSRDLVVDASEGTVRFGGGPIVHLPDTGDPAAADVMLRDEFGAVVHIDARGFDGSSSSASLSATGSIRVGTGDFVAIDPAATDFELIDPTSGSILRVNTTNVVRASQDVGQFEGTTDVFAAIDGIVEDLRNDGDLSLNEIQARMESRLSELIRNQDSILTAMGRSGAAGQRLASIDERLSGQESIVAGRLSEVEDMDLTEALINMTRAQKSLELAQSTGARLIQTTLLDYLR